MIISTNEQNVNTNSCHVPQLLTTKKIISAEVRDLNDAKFGHLIALVIDANSGEKSYGIISYFRFWMAEQFAVVPYDTLRLANQNQHYILDIELGSLDSMPSFDNDCWPDMNDPHWVAKIRGVYGSGFAHLNDS